VLAGERRLFDPARIRVVKLSSNTESQRASRNGLLDGAALTPDEALRLADVGMDLKIITLLDARPVMQATTTVEEES
jgi:NitT/TauT family transport system substrate-binding protein